MRRCLAVVVLLASLTGAAGPARAADPSGISPLEIVGYILYPIGFAVDRVVFGTFRWLGGMRPVQILLGLEPEPEAAAPPVAEAAPAGSEEKKAAESGNAPVDADDGNAPKRR